MEEITRQEFSNVKLHTIHPPDITFNSKCDKVDEEDQMNNIANIFPGKVDGCDKAFGRQ